MRLPPGSVGLLFLGFTYSPQPFQFGTLVPSPEVAVPMQSDEVFVGRWPELPPGTAIYAQAWFDVAGEAAATNAIVGLTK